MTYPLVAESGQGVLLAVSLRFLASFAMSATGPRGQKRAGEQLQSERTLPVPVAARAVEIASNNSNITYNFGRDVVNNNWVNNSFYPENAAADPMKKQVRAVATQCDQQLELMPHVRRRQCRSSRLVRTRRAL